VAQCCAGACLARARGEAAIGSSALRGPRTGAPTPGGATPFEQDLRAGLGEARAALGEEAFPAARGLLGAALPLPSIRDQLASAARRLGGAEVSSPG
jgi:hypothetical protein